MRNDAGLAYQPYNNDKGLKRPHSPVTQAVLFTNKYLPPSKFLIPLSMISITNFLFSKKLETESGITGNRLWYNPAKYAQAQTHHQWPMTNNPNRGYIQQTVPAHPILIPHNDTPPGQGKVVGPKTNSISIEKISAPQPDFGIHRRLLSAVPPSGQIVYPEYLPQNRDFANK